LNKTREVNKMPKDYLTPGNNTEQSTDIFGDVQKRFPHLREDFLSQKISEVKSQLEISDPDIPDFAEMSAYEQPELMRGGYKNEENAPAVEKGIEILKKKGQQAGPGILATVLMGLSSIQGGTGAEGFMKGYGALEGISDRKTKRDLENAMRDPNSPESQQARAWYAKNLKMTEEQMTGMSADDLDKRWPQIAEARKLEASKASSAAKLSAAEKAAQSKLEESRRKGEETAAYRERTEQLKREGLDIEKEKLEEMKKKPAQAMEKKLAEEKLKEHQEGADAYKKFKPTIAAVDRITELAKDVELGPIAGSAPVVYLKKLFGDTKMQELESLIKGLPLPVLKKTFGAAFTVKEGETLAESLANARMDAEAFMNAMGKMKSELEYANEIYKEEEKYLKEHGNLIGFETKVEYKSPYVKPEDSAVQMKTPDGRTVLVPADKVKEAESRGATRI